jgi:DNA-binding GntR family transcriptional regulator
MDYRTKEEQVADFLREGILSGQFPRGARLKQLEIAEMLKTSITPVREALKLLEAEGYITGGSYKGATVVPFDVSGSSEILNLRVLLEAQLVRGAVDKLRTEDIDTLRSFHRRIYDIAEMPQTMHFVQILWARYPFDLINRIGGRAERAALEHAELLNQMIAGDVTGATLTTRRHIESGWAELRAAL